MELVLTQDVKNLGKAGDEVKVKPGYGRNFLLAQDVAVLATPVAVERAAKVRDERQKKEKVMLDDLKKKMVDLKKLELVFTEKVKEDGKLYGSVGETEIVKAAEAKGFELKKSWVVLKEHLKDVGKFKVELKPHEDLEGFISVEIKAEEEKEKEEE